MLVKMHETVRYSYLSLNVEVPESAAPRLHAQRTTAGVLPGRAARPWQPAAGSLAGAARPWQRHIYVASPMHRQPTVLALRRASGHTHASR
jgi:hypothetical protein